MNPAALLLASAHVLVPPAGAAPSLDVRVDLDAGAVIAGGASLPIELDRASFPAESDVVVEVVAVAREQRVAHVRVPARDADAGGRAWEALLAPGHKAPLFAGITGFTEGDPGERTGRAIRIVPDGARSFVLVGDLREDLSICGEQATLLDPRAVYPGSLELKPATVQRLGAERTGAAQKLTAVERSEPLDAPLGKLLVARGSSVPGTQGGELTDGDPRTTWSERRPGAGQGEFVVMAAPKAVPIARMEIAVPASAGAEPAAAAPKTFYLATDDRTFEVSLPTDGARKEGATYAITFPEPVEASCVALVLDQAYTRGQAHPVVGVSELVAYGALDVPGASLDDVAAKLSGSEGAAAAAVLERAGDRALEAVARVYDRLDAAGRALAMDVAASHDRCEEAAPVLARGLCEASGEAPRRAREKLERCPGAAPALGQRLREDPSSASCVAPLLAAIARGEAIDPLADALAAAAGPKGDAASRAALRGSLAAALVEAPPSRVAGLLADRSRSPAVRLELLRAAGDRVAEARGETLAIADEVAREPPSMPARYRVLEPLAVLARAGEARAASRIAEAVAHDPDWPVRAHAADLARAVPAARAALLGALGDPEPRVRESALESLAASPGADELEPVRQLLARDAWMFVRARAASALGGAGPSREADRALGDALEDGSPTVRLAAVLALAERRATPWSAALRDRLEDANEEVEVRAGAAAALGALCDARAADRLTELARALASPGDDADSQSIGLGALIGLAALQPSGMSSRLAPLLATSAPPSVRAAAQRALAARGACR
jgi:HEAT repeat protein